MISISFILTSLVVILIPGTGVIYTVSTGLSSNRKYCIVAAIGCTLGIIPHLIASILGISAIMHTSATIFKVVKYIGVIYLVYLGYGLIKSRDMIVLDEKREKVHSLRIIGKGVLLNLLNPKLTLFFLSFIPQYLVPSKYGYTTQMIILSLIFMGMTLLVFILYGVLANSFKHFIKNSRRVTERIQQSFGLIMIGFAAKLAISDS